MIDEYQHQHHAIHVHSNHRPHGGFLDKVPALQAMTSLCSSLGHVVSGRREAEVNQRVSSTPTSGLTMRAVIVATCVMAKDLSASVSNVVVDTADVAAAVVSLSPWPSSPWPLSPLSSGFLSPLSPAAQQPSTCDRQAIKPGFHYPSWRPELTARVDGWPVSITRQHDSRVDRRAFPLVELTGRVDGLTRAQHGPCWQVMETGHPSTRAVNSGHQLG